MKNLTLIITIYNSKKYINNLLSFLDSFKVSTNVLFADDCSTDGTIDEINNWCKNNINSKLNISIKMTPKNIGLGKNREYIIKYVNTRYIIFSDVDDFIDLNQLKKVYDQIHKSKIVITNRVMIDKNRITSVNNFNNKTYFKYSFWAIWGIIFDIEIFKKITFLPRQDIGEDLNSFIALSNNDFNIVKTKMPVYYHIRYNNSMTGSEIIKTKKYYDSFALNLENFYGNSNKLYRDKILKYILIKSSSNIVNNYDFFIKFLKERNLYQKYFYKIFLSMVKKNTFIKLGYLFFLPEFFLYILYTHMRKPHFNKEQLNKIKKIISNY